MQLLTAGRKDVSALAFAPDGRALVAACRSGVPHLWALPAAGDAVPLSALSMYFCHALTFGPTADVVGWVNDSHRWEHDRRTGVTREPAIARAGEWVQSQAACGPDGRLVVRTTQHHAGAWVRGLLPDGAGGWAEAWAVGPTDVGGWQLVGCPGGRAFLWEASPHRDRRRGNALVARSALTGAEEARTGVPMPFVHGLAARPDGSALAFFRGSSLYLWTVGGPVVKARTGTLKHYRSACFHPDGRHLLAGNNDATARLIDTHSWRVVKQYTWAVGELCAVAVSPDGALAAAGSANGRVVVWDLDL